MPWNNKVIIYLLGVVFCLLNGLAVADESLVIKNYDYTKNVNTQNFDKVPQRVVSTNGSTTEILLKLGLEDHIVGTAYLDNPILPELSAAYAKVPVISPRYPSKEQVLALNPDFIFGWHSTFAPANLGDVQYWNKLGIQTYMLRNSGAVPEQRVENCFEDIRNIGLVFKVSAKAEAIIAQAKADLAAIELKTAGAGNKPKVLLSLSEAQGRFTARGANSLAGDILSRAGGESVFSKNGVYSLEHVINANPEVIIIIYMIQDQEGVADRLQSLRSHPILKQTKAVKTNQLYSIPLVETYAGVRTVDGLKRLAIILHPELFNESSFK